MNESLSLHPRKRKGKKMGKDKKVKVLRAWVSRSAWVVYPDWLAVGYRVWKQCGDRVVGLLGPSAQDGKSFRPGDLEYPDLAAAQQEMICFWTAVF